MGQKLWYELKIVAETGRSVDIAPQSVQPLTLDDLLPLSDEPNGPLAFRFTACTPASDGAQQDALRCFQFSVEFCEPPRIYALVVGGWLPPPFVMPPRFLIDRNIAMILRQQAGSRTQIGHPELNWWMDLLSGGDVWFNPLPCALENRERRTPTLDEFHREFDKVSRELRERFPGAHITTYEKPHLEAAYQLVTNLRRRMSKEEDFLINIAPLIMSPVPPRCLAGLGRKIFRTAASNLGADSLLAVVAALSCAFTGDEQSLGRLILKPSHKYSKADAFNALSDLRLIELAAASQGLQEVDAFSLCTRDRGLALFWCATRPRFNAWRGDVPSFTLDIDQRLFPRLTDREFVDVVQNLTEFSRGAVRVESEEG
jgi:hypothetical protein